MLGTDCGPSASAIDELIESHRMSINEERIEE
jgi:hypothetical protein